MLLGMLFRGRLGMMLRMHLVAMCHDGVMRRLLNRARFVVLGSLAMMLGGFLMMLGCLNVVLGSLVLRGR